jgi:hypothetical protein
MSETSGADRGEGIAVGAAVGSLTDLFVVPHHFDRVWFARIEERLSGPRFSAADG